VSKKVFEGLKIIEFAWVGVGPQASKYLADHGATVVRVESHTHFDLFRGASPFSQNKPGIDRSMFYGKYNSNKYHATLNLGLAKGQELARKFIRWADVMTESFRPGTMKRWGLDYEAVSKFKPEIIYVSTSMQGQTGPSAQFGGLGSLISAIAGFGEISGWPDDPPSPPYGAYSDYFCQRFLSATLIAALDYRERTGKGQWIEQSQLETSVYFNSPLILDYDVNGRVAGRTGNRNPYAAPHGVYPCKGDDRWIVIAVFDDHQWKCLCKRIGTTEISDAKYTTFPGRKENEDDLDGHLAKWTANQEAEELEILLQKDGIPSSVVKKSSDIYSDPQLLFRRYYVRMDHPEMGKPAYPHQSGYLLSKTPREILIPSPCMGEHNEYVYKHLLGMTDDEFSDRIADGSITVDLPEGFEFTANT